MNPNNVSEERAAAVLPFAPDENESAESFAAFLHYVDAGGKRSLTEVAEYIGTHVKSVRRWANEHNWAGRLQAYQMALIQTQFEAELSCRREMSLEWGKARNEMRVREWATAQRLLSILQRHVEHLEEAELGEIDLIDIARSLEIASKVARMATDLSDGEAPGEKPGAEFRAEFHAIVDRIYGEKAKREAAAANLPKAPQEAA